MKKIATLLLVCLMALGCLSGCKKEVPEPEPIKVEPITIEDLKGKISERDEVLKGMKGTYTIVSNNTQNDKSETKIKFEGESETETYQAEYLIKSTFKDGSWVVDSFETISSKKQTKTPEPEPTPAPTPEPTPAPTPEPTPSSSDITLTKEQIIDKIKEYLIKQDDLDTVSCDSITIDKTSGTAKMTGFVKWRYINDTNKYTVEFTGSGNNITITKATMTSQKTLCNLDDLKGMFKVHDENAKTDYYIEFSHDWQYALYEHQYEASSYPYEVKGSYSISGDTIKLNNPQKIYMNGQMLSTIKFKVAKVQLSTGAYKYQLTVLDNGNPFPAGTVLKYVEN